jgi:hypothetical protein
VLASCGEKWQGGVRKWRCGVPLQIHRPRTIREQASLEFQVHQGMDKTSVRGRVVTLFEKHRAAAGAAYDEHRFLDFLLADPKKTRAVYDSFRGLRRLNAFVDDIQYEFAICFSQHDRDANYSLQQFVERVIELGRSPRGSLRSLKNQARAGAGWPAVMVANCVLLIAAIWLKGNTWALVALASVAALLNAGFARFAWRANAYLKRLRARIEAAHDQSRDEVA